MAFYQAREKVENMAGFCVMATLSDDMFINAFARTPSHISQRWLFGGTHELSRLRCVNTPALIAAPICRLRSLQRATGSNNLCTDDSRDVYANCFYTKSLIVHFSMFHFAIPFPCFYFHVCNQQTKAFETFQRCISGCYPLHRRFSCTTPLIGQKEMPEQTILSTVMSFSSKEQPGAHFWLHDCANLLCRSSKQANINRRRTPFR